jgi:hypothetical protein
MLVSEFRASSGAPPLPASLPDDALLEDYLIKVCNHASRVERFVSPTANQRWKFYIDQDGVARGEVNLDILSVGLQVST